MEDSPPWSVASLIVSAVCVHVPASLLVDQLLKYQDRYHPDNWEADGRPAGFLFKTPNWIREDSRCLAKLNVLRVLEGFSLALIVAWIVLV